MEQKSKFQVHKFLNKMANYVEFVIAIALITVIAILLVQMLFENINIFINNGSIDFSVFLANLLNLIIGVEFTRMLCRHSAVTIIEVLMFATAKQIIVSNSSVYGTFLGIISIGILLIVRRYLLPAKSESEHEKFPYVSQIFRNRRKTVDTDEMQSDFDDSDEPYIVDM